MFVLLKCFTVVPCRVCKSLSFVMVVEPCRFIDDGRNPDEFTKDLLNNCVQRNQATKGKVDAFKVLP